jgi:hypothetical protein
VSSNDQDNPLYIAHLNLQLGNNNDTRWNLTFYMIERALRLREPLQLWIGANSMESEDRRLLTEKRLTSDDWEVSQAIVDLLCPSQEETMRFQSRSSGYIGWMVESLSPYFPLQRCERSPFSGPSCQA